MCGAAAPSAGPSAPASDGGLTSVTLSARSAGARGARAAASSAPPPRAPPPRARAAAPAAAAPAAAPAAAVRRALGAALRDGRRRAALPIHLGDGRVLVVARAVVVHAELRDAEAAADAAVDARARALGVVDRGPAGRRRVLGIEPVDRDRLRLGLDDRVRRPAAPVALPALAHVAADVAGARPTGVQDHQKRVDRIRRATSLGAGEAPRGFKNSSAPTPVRSQTS